MKYRTKPVIIEAFQYFEGKTSIMDLHRAFGKSVRFVFPLKIRHDGWYIVTLEGEMKISNGDYIIKGVNGEFYPCKLDIFEKTYERVE
ncbi:hypothetical protein LAV60_16295 [Clostridium sporogenes]|uniref:hypothetical protein n=1 Tax=Clostridium sporogenes TaxID=1509 RepID=UPI0022381335|nr:hypothetical protein [Clostridium sporogenes]MCW6094735.1 hypothetical protein [Clostridium sporogenes]